MSVDSFISYKAFKRQVMEDVLSVRVKEGDFWKGAVFIQNRSDTFFMIPIDDISNASNEEYVTEIVCDLIKHNSPKYVAVLYPSIQEYEYDDGFYEILAMSLFIGDIHNLEYFEATHYEEEGVLYLDNWEQLNIEHYPPEGQFIRRAQVYQND